MAIRIAQDMGMHSESELAKWAPAEAELRRRLWWALILFDNRMCELAGSRVRTLDPVWTCQIPSNINDYDLDHARGLPIEHTQCSEAIFPVLRCKVRDFVRRAAFHIEYANPTLAPLISREQRYLGEDAAGLEQLEQNIENDYLQHCDMRKPIHLMAKWTTTGYLSKIRLLELESRQRGTRQTDVQYELALAYALRVIHSDTVIMSSPLTKGFLWLHYQYFPFQAYLVVCRTIQTLPHGDLGIRAWQALSQNYLWWSSILTNNTTFLTALAKIVLQAWHVYEAELRSTGTGFDPPEVITSLNQTMEHLNSRPELREQEQPSRDPGTAWNDGSAAFGLGAFDIENLFDGTGLLSDDGATYMERREHYSRGE